MTPHRSNHTDEAPVIVITGATSGIGELAAIEFARRGARLVITARSRGRAENTIARPSTVCRKWSPSTTSPPGCSPAPSCRHCNAPRARASSPLNPGVNSTGLDRELRFATTLERVLHALRIAMDTGLQSGGYYSGKATRLVTPVAPADNRQARADLWQATTALLAKGYEHIY